MEREIGHYIKNCYKISYLPPPPHRTISNFWTRVSHFVNHVLVLYDQLHTRKNHISTVRLPKLEQITRRPMREKIKKRVRAQKGTGVGKTTGCKISKSIGNLPFRIPSTNNVEIARLQDYIWCPAHFLAIRLWK